MSQLQSLLGKIITQGAGTQKLPNVRSHQTNSHCQTSVLDLPGGERCSDGSGHNLPSLLEGSCWRGVMRGLRGEREGWEEGAWVKGKDVAESRPVAWEEARFGSSPLLSEPLSSDPPIVIVVVGEDASGKSAREFWKHAWGKWRVSWERDKGGIDCAYEWTRKMSKREIDEERERCIYTDTSYIYIYVCCRVKNLSKNCLFLKSNICPRFPLFSFFVFQNSSFCKREWDFQNNKRKGRQTNYQFFESKILTQPFSHVWPFFPFFFFSKYVATTIFIGFSAKVLSCPPPKN